MKRRRSNPNASLELFLDTVCNVFGGILFIAILIAIQIRQTEGEIEKPKESPTPEMIEQLQTELAQMTADIVSAQTLLETVRKTMPKPSHSDDKAVIDLYEQLSAAKGEAVKKKGELVSKLLATEKEMVELEQKVKDVDARLKEQTTAEQELVQQIQDTKSKNQTVTQTAVVLKEEIDKLSQQVTQKEKVVKDKTSKTERNETLYLPKLRTGKTTQTIHLVLRFNRLYDASNRNDFISVLPNELGTPKSDRGFAINGTADFKKNVETIIKIGNSATHSVTFIVYGDTADQFYQVRDIIINAGFEYALLPSEDNEIWTFGGTGGTRDVQ